MTPQQWGDLVRNAFPGYTGARPRMQIWHGTQDTTLQYPNFGEQIKQWTNVHGLSQTPSFTDTPQSGWTRTRYGGTGTMAPVEAISIANTGHNLPLNGQAAMAIAFFGLNNHAAHDAAGHDHHDLTAADHTAGDDHDHHSAGDDDHQHPAAGRRSVPGLLRHQRLEQRADDVHHDHQHQQRDHQRLDIAVHPPGWTDHHLWLERELLADQRSGDGAQHELQRCARAQRVHQHRLPGHPHR